jgi:hypothetical protein
MAHFHQVRTAIVDTHRHLAEWRRLQEDLNTHDALLMPPLQSGCVDVRFLNTLMFMHCHAMGPEVSCDTQLLPLSVCTNYVRWCVVGRALHSIRDLLARKCPGAMRNDFTFDKSFCEMDSVHDWSYTELRDAKKGGFVSHLFRREFLPVLDVILKSFASTDPG